LNLPCNQSWMHVYPLAPVWYACCLPVFPLALPFQFATILGNGLIAPIKSMIPILVKDPSKILFCSGFTPQSMQRIDCTPGHVFEINNQAKHAISNCDTAYSWVNIRLDYTQGPGPNRIILDTGERLVQTRCSIDRLKDTKQRPTPFYIVLGAQKAGTTPLYDYINQHPWVVKAQRRETHCLDWRWNETLKTPKSQKSTSLTHLQCSGTFANPAKIMVRAMHTHYGKRDKHRTKNVRLLEPEDHPPQQHAWKKNHRWA
jgi:hypothetical protein